MDADTAIETVGGFGLYQYCLILQMGFLELMAVGFQLFLMSFVAGEPPWECQQNSTNCTMNGRFSPSDKDYTKRCDMLSSDWKFVDDYTSVVTEWDLVCDRSILGNVASSMLFVGWLLGVVIFGIISDKSGRKLSLFVSTQMTFITALISAFSPAFWFFIVCRLIIGFGVGGCSMILFIIPTEYTGVKHRGTAGTSIWFFSSFGHMLMSLLAYLMRDWKTLTIVSSAPGILFIGFWWFTPESVRWLLIHGRTEEAEKNLRKVARMNKRVMPQGNLGLSTIVDKSRSGNISDLFRSRKLTFQILIQWFSWFSVALVYFGVSYSATILGGNMYLNFFLASLIEIPSNLGAIWFMNRFGRKKAVIIGLLVASIASLIALAFPYDGKTGTYAGRLTVALIAKFFVLVSFDAIYVFSAELIPTVVRNVGMGTCSAIARIGSFSSLYIIWLRRIHIMLPFSIIGIVAFVAAILCLFLPETNLKPTAEFMQDSAVKPNTVNEMHVMAKDQQG